jgi:hypothetical protein
MSSTYRAIHKASVCHATLFAFEKRFLGIQDTMVDAPERVGPIH